MIVWGPGIRITPEAPPTGDGPEINFPRLITWADFKLGHVCISQLQRSAPSQECTKSDSAVLNDTYSNMSLSLRHEAYSNVSLS